MKNELKYNFIQFFRSSLNINYRDTKRHTTQLENSKPETQVLFKPDQQLHQKYHYILNENTILKREKHDLEVQVIHQVISYQVIANYFFFYKQVLALKRDNEMKSTQLLNENQILKSELDKLKQVKGQNFTISKCM